MSEVKTQENENLVISNEEQYESEILKEERELLGIDAAPDIAPPLESGDLPPLINADIPQTSARTPQEGADILPPLNAHESGIDARDREFLAALGAVLENSRQHSAPQPQPQPAREEESHAEKIAVGVVKKGVGVISLALILIFMGIVLVCTLFSEQPDYLLPLKLSPVAAVLVGLELLAHYLASGKHFRVHIPSIVISAFVVVGCCAMACVMNNSYSETTAEYNNRSVAAEIYDSSYRELRHVADIAQLSVEVDLNTNGSDRKKGLESLTSADIVRIECELSGSYSSPREFAADCKSIIDGYRFLDIPVTEFSFVNEGKLHRFALNVEGKFEQDYSESELADNVDHIYYEDYDYIPDLEDFTLTEESEETMSVD